MKGTDGLILRFAALFLCGAVLASCDMAGPTSSDGGDSSDQSGQLIGSDVGTAISAQDVTGDYLIDPGNGENWPSIGYSYDNRRFSPLDEINADTIGDFGLLWSAPLGDSDWRGSTPIAVDGRIYVGDPVAGVAAYDAVSGQRVWQYDPEISDKALDEVRCAKGATSGVAIARGRLFFGQRDGRLTALDSSTGAVLWSSQISENSRRPILSVPLVVGNHIIVGSSKPCAAGAGNQTAARAARGYISAYVIQDGELAWRFYTVPTREQINEALAQGGSGLLTEAARSWPDTTGGEEPGGGFVPGNIVFDSQKGDLLFGTGERSATTGRRPQGRGLFSSSLIALDPESGRYKWHRQLAPGGVGWSANAPIVFAPLMNSKPKSDDGANDPAAQPTDENQQASAGNADSAEVREAWLPLENGWLVAASKASAFLAHSMKYGGGYSPVESYSSESGNAVLVEGKMRAAEGIHKSDMPVSYSPLTGFLYINRSPISGPSDDVEGKTEPAALLAISPGADAPAWTIENAGAAPLVTAGGLLFATYKAPFGTGLAILNAKTGEPIYFRGDIVPLGGMATFVAGGRQMVAFPAIFGGEPRIVVMGLGGRERYEAET